MSPYHAMGRIRPTCNYLPKITWIMSLRTVQTAQLQSVLSILCFRCCTTTSYWLMWALWLTIHFYWLWKFSPLAKYISAFRNPDFIVDCSRVTRLSIQHHSQCFFYCTVKKPVWPWHWLMPTMMWWVMPRSLIILTCRV